MFEEVNHISRRARIALTGAALLFSALSHAQLGLISNSSLGFPANALGLSSGLDQSVPTGGVPEQASPENFLNINESALMVMLSPEPSSDNITKYQTAAAGISTILLNPSQYTPIPFAPPLVFGFVPGFKAIYTEPEKSPKFFLSGGSIFSPSLLLLPSLPIISAPLPAEIQGVSQTIPFGEAEAVDPISPQEALSTAFSSSP